MLVRSRTIFGPQSPRRLTLILESFRPDRQTDRLTDRERSDFMIVEMHPPSTPVPSRASHHPAPAPIRLLGVLCLPRDLASRPAWIAFPPQQCGGRLFAGSGLSLDRGAGDGPLPCPGIQPPPRTPMGSISPRPAVPPRPGVSACPSPRRVRVHPPKHPRRPAPASRPRYGKAARSDSGGSPDESVLLSQGIFVDLLRAPAFHLTVALGVAACQLANVAWDAAGYLWRPRCVAWVGVCGVLRSVRCALFVGRNPACSDPACSYPRMQ